MVFSSYNFLFIFLPTLVILYFMIPATKKSLRNYLLVLFSLIFYSWGMPKYLALLLLSIFLNWSVGYLLNQDTLTTKIKRFILYLGVAINCLVLGIFKYTDFVIVSINGLVGLNLTPQNIVLPIGISFYTFQGISYIVDIYKNKAKCLNNPLMVALYISLFPQLIAGPIVRFESIAQQIYQREESFDKVLAGIKRFILGLTKKIIFADTFGIMADLAFSSTTLTTGLAWIGAIAYTLQIYFDFSGYSDMAIGLGKIFGFDFCENFNYPYISKSITEFWRRWHISLSSWFKDYVYIPLGGNKLGIVRQIFNLSVVWALTGLWHGASWNFIFWGLYYLVWLLLEKFFLVKYYKYLPDFIKNISAMLIVMFGWVLFRADNLTKAIYYYKMLLGLSPFGLGYDDIMRFVSNYLFFWIVGLLLSTPWLFTKLQKISQRFENKALFSFLENCCWCMLWWLCIIYIIASSYNSFLYFQF